MSNVDDQDTGSVEAPVESTGESLDTEKQAQPAENVIESVDKKEDTKDEDKEDENKNEPPQDLAENSETTNPNESSQDESPKDEGEVIEAKNSDEVVSETQKNDQITEKVANQGPPEERPEETQLVEEAKEDPPVSNQQEVDQEQAMGEQEKQNPEQVQLKTDEPAEENEVKLVEDTPVASISDAQNPTSNEEKIAEISEANKDGKEDATKDEPSTTGGGGTENKSADQEEKSGDTEVQSTEKEKVITENADKSPVESVQAENAEDGPVESVQAENAEDGPVESVQAENAEDGPVESVQAENAEDGQAAKVENGDDSQVEIAQAVKTEDSQEETVQVKNSEDSPEEATEVANTEESLREEKAEDTKDGADTHTATEDSHEKDNKETEPTETKEEATVDQSTEPPVVSQSKPVDTDTKPEDFYYNYEEHASGSYVTPDSGIPSNLLHVFHSFGYDCKKRSNLFLLPGPTALFAAGNLVHLVDLTEGTHRYLRSSGGGGIGALAVHPSLKYFTVAEKGVKPDIMIYEFPSLKLFRILKEGTEKAYSFVDFNPNGNLLASVGCAPDFMLTVWDWTNEKVMLRSKAFSQEIFRVKFAPEQEGQLTSSGTGHIRFWKMARTFTGLKLKGELGRFGKTALTDIDGFVQLPDGKVLSGAEWGNLLLWDGGLIKVEICRKGNKPCHVGSIQQLVIDEGELITIGVDGYVRVWEMESIDTADTTDDSDVFEVEPMNELKVGQDVQLTSMVKLRDPNQKNEADDSIASIWYAQDASGGIWKLDLSFSHTTKPPEKLHSFTSGLITGITTSPASQLFAVTGDPYIRIYDYVTKDVVCEYRCPMSSNSTSILWPGKMTYEKCNILLVGFSNGLLRALTLQKSNGKNTISLKQVLKPHTSDVTALSIHASGRVLATGSTDSTVFFFRLDSTIEPIGFVSVPGPVTHLQWSPVGFTKSTLLVSCQNGKVAEIDAPMTGSYDTSHSFKLDLHMKYFSFKSVKSQLRRDEERERKRIERENKLKEKQKELKRRKDRGEEFTEEEERDFLKIETEEEEEEPLFIPASPSPIYSAFYSGENKFVVSVGDYDAGYLYECQFSPDREVFQNPDVAPSSPIGAIAVPDCNDIPATRIYHSSGARSLLVGFENGKIRAYPLPENIDMSTFKMEAVTLPYWELSMHDCETGLISSIAESHDGAYLFTGGSDGNIYGYNFLPFEDVYKAMEGQKARLPSARKEDITSADDIDDPNAYSIEDAKLKAEHDRYMKEAEAKKSEERQKLAKLRSQFQELLEQNDQLPKSVRLDRSEFELDPTLRINMHEATNKKIERVKLEMQWEKEKLALATRKIRDRFSAMIDCPRIMLHAIRTSHTISSYRINSLGDEYFALEKQMKERTVAAGLDDGSLKGRKISDNLDMKRKELREDTLDQQEFLQGAVKKQKGTNLQGRQAEKVAKAIKKAEEAKRKRDERQKQWEDLYKSKPADNYEDPADIAAIQEAKANIGDFKLKTASDYVVPEHLRMDTEKKKSQILVLQGLIHQEKSKFNKWFRDLREDKQKRIEQIKAWVNEIKDIQNKLDANLSKPVPKVPQMKPDELPEKKYEYTRETLLQFEASEKDREEKSKKVSNEGLGSFGGFNQNQGEEEVESSRGGKSVAAISTPTRSRHPSRPNRLPSRLETELAKRNEIILLHRRDQLLKFIEKSITQFDAKFHLLRHEKTFLDVDLKMADLRQITLLEEFLILKEYEKRETMLSGRVMSKRTELNEMHSKVAEMQVKLEAKRRDIEKLTDREKSLNATLAALIGENNKFGDFLNKVFRKKIKRAKKKKVDEGQDEESEMSSDDESDWSSEEDDDDSVEGGLDDSVCPPGCDQQTFDDVLEMREKRLDIEEALVEEKKLADQQKKDMDSLNKKSKIMESQLKTAMDALEEFQVEKQGKLNELDVVVPLRLSQVEHVSNGVVPNDLSSCLVFTNQSLLGLQRRIKELQHEKAEQRSYFKNSRMQHVRLIKDRKVMESKIERLEEKCEQMMMLKFGRIVDLDKLDSVTVNKTVEELKQTVHNTELKNDAKLRKLDHHIQSLKDRITELTRDNTRLLETYNVLAREKTTLEKNLDHRQKDLNLEQRTDKKSDLRERQRLMQLVQLQAQEIQALKEEIGLLSRKGGHILPPAQPPIPREGEL